MKNVHIFLFIGRRRVVIKEVKPPPYSNWEPTLVIANPKSGGNEGVKLLRAFRLLLNPAQVNTNGFTIQFKHGYRATIFVCLSKFYTSIIVYIHLQNHVLQGTVLFLACFQFYFSVREIFYKMYKLSCICVVPDKSQYTKKKTIKSI